MRGSRARLVGAAALLFPGQGAQRPLMAADLARDFPEARHALLEVDEALGARLSSLMQSSAPDAAAQLARTEAAQPALLAHSVAALRALRAELEGAGASGAPPLYSLAPPPLVLGPRRVACVLGHSVGEYAGLVTAGALPLADAARLLQFRARVMQQAVDDDAVDRAPAHGARGGVRGMLALLLSPPVSPPLPEPAPLSPLMATVQQLERCCREAEDGGGVAAVASINSPTQVVLSGHMAALERAIALFKALDNHELRPRHYAVLRKAVRLPVGAPFHCALMHPAATKMRRAFLVAGELADRGASDPGLSDALVTAAAAAARSIASPRVPLVSNVDAAPHRDAGTLRGLLADGLCLPVRWAEGTLCARLVLGADHFVELGPGTALGAFVRATLGLGDREVWSVGTSVELRKYVRHLEAK